MIRVLVRKASKEDFKHIQELDYRLFLHDKKYDKYLNMKWPYQKTGIDYITSKIKGIEGVCFVAINNNGEIIGYLIGEILSKCLYRTIKKQAELVNIFINKEYRNQKVGLKLFNKFKTWCNKQGVKSIKVRMCAQDLGVYEFYSKLGFSPYVSELECKIGD